MPFLDYVCCGVGPLSISVSCTASTSPCLSSVSLSVLHYKHGTHPLVYLCVVVSNVDFFKFFLILLIFVVYFDALPACWPRSFLDWRFGESTGPCPLAQLLSSLWLLP